MNEFKVGDWVEFDNSIFCVHKEYNGNRYISEEVANNLANYGKSVTLWHPKESEWCWFWDGYGESSPLIGKYSLLSSWNENYYCIIEPFIGKLPSFLKENNHATN